MVDRVGPEAVRPAGTLEKLMDEIEGQLSVECPVCRERVPVVMTDEDDVTITMAGGIPNAVESALTVRIEHTCRAKASMRVHAGPDGPVRGISVTVPGTIGHAEAGPRERRPASG